MDQIKIHPKVHYPSSAASLFASHCRETRQPSFRSLFGREPVIGIDFDPTHLSQDDRDFLTGQGNYSEER